MSAIGPGLEIAWSVPATAPINCPTDPTSETDPALGIALASETVPAAEIGGTIIVLAEATSISAAATTLRSTATFRIASTGQLTGTTGATIHGGIALPITPGMADLGDGDGLDLPTTDLPPGLDTTALDGSSLGGSLAGDLATCSSIAVTIITTILIRYKPSMSSPAPP